MSDNKWGQVPSKTQSTQPQPQQEAVSGEHQTPIAESETPKNQTSQLTDLKNKSDDFANVDDILAKHTDPKTDAIYYELSNYFNLEDHEQFNRDNLKRLSAIFEWAVKETKSDAREDVLTAIRELEDKLSSQPYDTNTKRINKLFAYLRLAVQSNSITKAMKAYEK
jgi:hypothetical protein